MSIQKSAKLQELFDSEEDTHVFSRNYQDKKKKLIYAVKEQEKKREKRRRYRAIAAAVAAALLIPTTVYAANKIFRMHVEREKYQMDIKVQKDNNAAEQGNNGKLYAPVKLEYTYLPEGSELFEAGSYKYHVPEDKGSDAHSVSGGELYKLDVDEAEFKELFSTEYKEFTVNNHQAILIQKDSTFAYDKKLYVIFEDYGYIVGAYLGNEIDEAEAIKIAEGIRLKETDEANATFAGSIKEAKEWEVKDDAEGDIIQKIETSWCKIGDSIAENYSGYEIKITEVEVLDNISTLDKNKFWEDMAGISEYVDENGNLLTYGRQELIEGDGTTSLNEYSEKETVKKKFVYVTWAVSKPEIGIIEEDDEIAMNFPLYFISGDKKDTMNLMGVKNEEVIYFDAPTMENTHQHYFTVSLAEGDTITCHTGYLVDEDMLDKMYINVSYDAALNKLVDICQ